MNRQLRLSTQISVSKMVWRLQVSAANRRTMVDDSGLPFMMQMRSHYFPDEHFVSQAAMNMFHGRRVMHFHLTWFGTLYGRFPLLDHAAIGISLPVLGDPVQLNWQYGPSRLTSNL